MHEELQQNRLRVGESKIMNKAEFEIHYTTAEKRVQSEKDAQRRKELNHILNSKHASAQQKARLPELRKPVNKQLYVMALHPNGEVEYGQLFDVRAENIGQAILKPVSTSHGSGSGGSAAAAAVPAALHVRAPWSYLFAEPRTLSLVDWWRSGSEGRESWDVETSCAVRVAVVQLYRPSSAAASAAVLGATSSSDASSSVAFAFFPADRVWRCEAYVPWDVDEEAQKQAVLAAAEDAAAVAADGSEQAAAAAVGADPAPHRAVANSPAPQHYLQQPTVVPLFPCSVSMRHTFSVRDSFVSAPGYVLLSVDYSNIELRMMAHFSVDPALIALFHQRVDVLTAMAAQLFGLPPEQPNLVTPKQRATAKSCVYALLYGCLLYTSPSPRD